MGRTNEDIEKDKVRRLVYKCNKCEYTADKEGHIIFHMRTHPVDRVYKCKVCDYTTNKKNYLAIHARTHVNNCRICNHPFFEASCLLNHMIVYHIGEA